MMTSSSAEIEEVIMKMGPPAELTAIVGGSGLPGLDEFILLHEVNAFGRSPVLMVGIDFAAAIERLLPGDAYEVRHFPPGADSERTQVRYRDEVIAEIRYNEENHFLSGKGLVTPQEIKGQSMDPSIRLVPKVKEFAGVKSMPLIWDYQKTFGYEFPIDIPGRLFGGRITEVVSLQLQGKN